VKITWILVADSSRAQVFETGGASRDANSITEHIRARDK
jgi:hypothetical protein